MGLVGWRERDGGTGGYQNPHRSPSGRWMLFPVIAISEIKELEIHAKAHGAGAATKAQARARNRRVESSAIFMVWILCAASVAASRGPGI